MKRTAVVVALLALGSACSTFRVDGPDNEQSVTQNTFWDRIVTDGSLRLAVRDSAARPGVFYGTPTIESLPGAIEASNTRYGSFCIYDVTGSADVQGSKIGVRIKFSERLTSCPGEVRALSYQATLSGLRSGQAYEVAVIHEQNGRADTVRTAVVTVR